MTYFSMPDCCCHILTDSFDRPDSTNPGPQWIPTLGTWRVRDHALETTDSNAVLLALPQAHSARINLTGAFSSDAPGSQGRLIWNSQNPSQYDYLQWTVGSPMIEIFVGGNRVGHVTRACWPETAVLSDVINLCALDPGWMIAGGLDVVNSRFKFSHQGPSGIWGIGSGNVLSQLSCQTVQAFEVSDTLRPFPLADTCQPCLSFCDFFADRLVPARWKVSLRQFIECDCLNGDWYVDYLDSFLGCRWGIPHQCNIPLGNYELLLTLRSQAGSIAATVSVGRCEGGGEELFEGTIPLGSDYRQLIDFALPWNPFSFGCSNGEFDPVPTCTISAL